MRIEKKVTYPGSVQEVTRALTSRELAEKRAAAFKVDDIQHEVTDSDADHPASTTVINVDSAQLPSKVRKFAPSTIRAEVEQKWSLASDDAASGALTVNAGGLPVKIQGSQQLRAMGVGETEATFLVDFSVSIPFIGKKVESMAAGKVDHFLAQDAKLVAEVLAAGGSQA